MGLKKTIYIPSQEVWDTIVSESERKGVSVSDLLVAGFKREPQLDRIEGMLKAVLNSKPSINPINVKLKLPDSEPFVSPKEPEYVPSYSDGNIRPIPKESPKEKKLDALKAMMPKNTVFNPQTKKGGK